MEMNSKSSWSSCTFELEDIEIINHKTQHEEKMEKWNCDQCNLFYLEKHLLEEHILKNHSTQEIVKCRYCNKTISCPSADRESFVNRKCETCEYKCSSCPQRFLRHSSLVNHEKKHSSPKKKKTSLSNKKKDISIIPESNGFQRKDGLEAKSTKSSARMSYNPKANSKKKLNLKEKSQSLLQGCETLLVKRRGHLSSKKSISTKRSNRSVSPMKLPVNAVLEEKQSNFKNKLNSFSGSHSSSTTSSNVSNGENSVNYKPFSCHVCGDTFASDGVLLDHIKTHGENAAKSFRCKYCGDEFDDIYKMQYHLAICSLAEDDLESSIKHAIPVNTTTKIIPNKTNRRKRGRPKKLIEKPQYLESNDEPSVLTNVKGTLRKRKLVVTESNKSTNVPSDLPIPTKLKKFENKNASTKSNSKLAKVTGEKISDGTANMQPVTSIDLKEDDDRKKVHSCPFPRCDFKFSREKALLCHMRNHSDDFEDSLKCHKCDIPFDDIPNLRQHINTCKGIKEEKDDDFNRSGSHESSPNRLFQRTKKDFACYQCGRSYHNQDKLNSHNCPGDTSNSVCAKFPCRLCGILIHSPNMLKTHFQEHHPNNLQFHCPSCGAEFDNLQDVNTHMREHIKLTFYCTLCSKRMKTKAELNRHYAVDHCKSDRSICLVCNKKFADGTGLAKHRYIHTGERPYFCPFCFVTFNLKSSHVNHIRRHMNFRPYKCHICSKTFFNSGDLSKHIRLHTGEKPYNCKICNSRFRLKDALNAHMKTHGNIRPYKCIKCSKAFRTKAFLRYHLPIHSGIQSFHCSICPLKYFSNITLRGHIKRCHVTSSLKCEICKATFHESTDLITHIISHNNSGATSKHFVPLQKTSESSTSFGVKKKRGRPKKTSESSTSFGVIRKRGRPRKTCKPSLNSKAQNFPSSQSSKHLAKEQENVVESGNIIEIVESIKEEVQSGNEEDCVNDFVTVKEQCLICWDTFGSLYELMDHVKLHIL